MPCFSRSLSRAIVISSALAALFVAMPSAHATCFEDCKAELSFEDCTKPPMGTWPFGTPLSFVASCQVCCSPPGGPVSCSPSQVNLMGVSVQDANFNAVPGVVAAKNVKCQDVDLFSFDGQLATGQHNLVIGNLIVSQFEVVEAGVGGGGGAGGSSSSSSSSGSAGGAGGAGGQGTTSSSSSSSGSAGGNPGNGSGSEWGCAITQDASSTAGFGWALAAIAWAGLALRRRRSSAT